MSISGMPGGSSLFGSGGSSTSPLSTLLQGAANPFSPLATNPNSSTSGMALSGLVSGIDTSTIVDELMAVAQQPVQLLQSQQSYQQSQLSAFNQIVQSLGALNSAVTAMTDPTIYQAKSATVDSGHAGNVSATATSKASAGSFQVTVNNLATQTSVDSTANIGQPISANVALANAGFALTPTTGTFSINGYAITIDQNTVLSDGTDAVGANTIVAKVRDATGGKITASVVADAYGNSNVLQLKTQGGIGPIQVGSGSDTSNFLSAANLAGGTSTAVSAASVTGNAMASGAIGSTTMVINGVTINTTATAAGNTAEQNAQSMATDINNAFASVSGANKITASTNGSGALLLNQSSSGAAYQVGITNAGTGTGLTAGTTYGTDKLSGTGPMGQLNPSVDLTNARLATALTQTSGTVQINGVTINWDSTKQSLNDIISAIDGSAAGVTASYDSTQDKFILTNTQTGAIGISLKDQSGNLLQALGVLNATQKIGANASYSISTLNNGQNQTSTSNVITTIPGVTVTLQAPTTAGSPATVTVAADASKALTAAQNFADAYNTVQSQIEQVTSYNKQTNQTGFLFDDPGMLAISGTLSQDAFNLTSLSGQYKSLADIGFNTGAPGLPVGSQYQLQVDSTAFTQAITTNPTAVAQLFTDATQGIATQLNSYINSQVGTNGVLTQQASTMQQGINNIGDEITQWNTRLTAQRQQYTDEFQQMELNLGTLKAQQSEMQASMRQLGQVG